MEIANRKSLFYQFQGDQRFSADVDAEVVAGAECGGQKVKA